ncbi:MULTISPECIES: DUF2129 domain-containing protein [unclassified Streptococcus]|uniref:DUF2129 domain-containing protein n=1 Tax=unclassified Streptococcus TaxID=2608887 RepID=UPI00359DBBBC
METPSRVGLFVHLYYNRDSRKLNKYGDFHYHSKKCRYVLIYVPSDDIEAVMTELKALKFVKSVQPSYLDDIDRQFVGNLTAHELV